MIKNLGKNKSILNQYIAELRDIDIQKDMLRFRTNLYRIGQFFAIEISKTLEYEEKEVITSLGAANVPVLKDCPVIVPILRAGLPMHEGVQSVFDKAPSAFISAYRKAEKNEEFTIQIEYVSSPDLDGKVVIMCDPMLATGASAVEAYKALLRFGKPSHTHFIAAIASMEGVNHMKKRLSSKEFTIWTGAVMRNLQHKPI